eukprot:360782-Chlamydomonas_euryale.AAC.1
MDGWANIWMNQRLDECSINNESAPIGTVDQLAGLSPAWFICFRQLGGTTSASGRLIVQPCCQPACRWISCH